ncbi:MAG TPA: DUF1292 domain-containing protein [Epulopiscium sp.]|nr:DUF1292 domain-containing protein [Candidatus Epulonipiscium sp.]
MTDHKDCDCNHEEDQVIYVVFDGEDEEVACDVLGVFEVEDRNYIAITPQDSDDDVLLYGFEEENDEVNLIEIETDEEYEKVAVAFEKEFFDEEEEDQE